jgi:ATP/maltotriose-dependent transcriptional regulator MalT
LWRWLERLPREVVRPRPRLCLDLAWVLLWSMQVEAVEPWLLDAEHALGALGTAALPAEATGLKPAATSRALHGEIAALRAKLARQRSALGAAIALAHRALDNLPADAWRVRSVTTGLLAGAYISSGDAAAAGEAAEAITLALPHAPPWWPRASSEATASAPLLKGTTLKRCTGHRPIHVT